MFDKFKNILSTKKHEKTNFEETVLDNKKEEDEEKLKLVLTLTQREYEMYLLLVEGYALKECAAQLDIKYSTANTHMTSIYKKLNVNTKASLIIKYRDIRL